MPEFEVRAAVAEDFPGIASAAVAAGQDTEWSGADRAYMTHLLARGRVAVCVTNGGVAGFGAAAEIVTGAGGTASMLCDLFVRPEMHGRGFGRAILSWLWPGGGRRMTFSSLHPSALPLYASFGLDAWWPLLYLRGRPGSLAVPDGWRAETVPAATVAALERDWTGAVRDADHQAWERRPDGTGLLARHGGRVLAAATAGGSGSEYGITHLALSPGIDDAGAAAAVLTTAAGLEPAGGQALACLPAPHPAVRPLLAAGWRADGFDLFMATSPDLLDPRRAVPSPALA